MDTGRFDVVCRTLFAQPSRRGFLGLGLAGGITAIVEALAAEAKKKKRKKKKKKRKPPSCTPDCTGKTCGDNGCGGSCGACQGSKTCQAGTCGCPPGEYECEANICVPTDALCCTEFQCNGIPGPRCLHGQCVIWQGTCPADADSCASAVGCNGMSGCACYQSIEGETRCGTGIPNNPADCEQCESSADCAELFPEIPGVFCVQKGDGPNCCPGSCQRPCPSPF